MGTGTETVIGTGTEIGTGKKKLWSVSERSWYGRNMFIEHFS